MAFVDAASPPIIINLKERIFSLSSLVNEVDNSLKNTVGMSEIVACVS